MLGTRSRNPSLMRCSLLDSARLPLVALVIALVIVASLPLRLTADEGLFVPATDGVTTAFVGPGIPDDFDATRLAIADVRKSSGRAYRVVVVKASGIDGGAASLLPRIVDRWWEARDTNQFDPAADITIVLDIGDRSVAMDVPPSVLSKAGLDLRTLEREVIDNVFVPRAKDMRYAEGLAEMVTATDRALTTGIADRARAAEAAGIFRTRTLPTAAASLLAAGIIGGFGIQRLRHATRRTAAGHKLAAFKQDVVALSDMLDASQERHRMLPHTDPDFQTPMRGMTRDTYDAVQDAIRRYRERWLSLMEVWDKAQERLASEWFLGTAASDAVITMLDAAEARPPLDEVSAACRGPLDSLENAHETARGLATDLQGDMTHARERLDGLARRGRLAAAFEPVVADAARAAERAAADVEPDPVAARGRLEAARGKLGELATRLDGLEATDDRRGHVAGRIDEVRSRVAARRAEGWLLTEPGADPEPRLATADSEADLAGRLLDAADTETAAMHLGSAEEAIAEAATLLETVAVARARAEELLPALAARLDAVAATQPQAGADLSHLAERYAHSAWGDVADNAAKAHEGTDHGRRLVEEAHAAADPARQHFFRAVAALEEAERQATWAAACVAAIHDRRAELDGLARELPERLQASRNAARALAVTLERQRTDRPRAHERFREAERLVERASDLLRVSQPDPREIDRIIDAAGLAIARGEELAAEDERLAQQATADSDEADGVLRRAAAWYDEGVRADVRSAKAALDAARRFLAQSRYEDAIRAAADASQQARLAYATATAEAERRRERREAERRRRQMEESYSNMTRGAGPWVINLPTGPFTGPEPWRSSTSTTQAPVAGRTTRSAKSGWTRDIATGRW